MGKTWDFVKVLKVEPYVTLIMFAYFLKTTVFAQLIQDKYCVNSLNQSVALCYNVTSSAGSRHEAIKDDILRTSNKYTVYNNLIITIPGVFYTFFVGSWSDRFVSARKLMMVFGAIGITCDAIILISQIVFFEWSPAWLLLTNIPSTLVGGFFTVFTAIYSYAAKTTPPEYRSIRFAKLELCMFISMPLSAISGSFILDTSPWFLKDRIRNYMAVYLLNTVVGLLALIYVAISINEKQSDPDTESIVNEDTTEQELLHQDNEASSWYSPLKSLFDLTNVRTMIQVLTKHRQGKDRTVLWVMVLGHSLIFLGYMGGSAVCYQFTQKAFSWSFEKYNNVNATTSSLGILSTMAAIPLFIKYFKFRDLTMVITGTLSVFLTMTLRGTLLTEIGFYVAYFIGTLTPVAMIASRSFLSKLVTQDEGGTVFAILSCLEAVVPLIATSLFTGIFNDTIDTMPGLVYQCAGALLVIPLTGYLWVDHHYRVNDYSRAAT